MLECTVKLFRRFLDLLGTHPVDTKRLTIANFSNYAGHLELFRKKRPAMFSPSIPIIYRTLKAACMGGIVQASRHKCDPADTEPGAGINAHLYEADDDDDDPQESDPKEAELDEVMDDVMASWPRDQPLPCETTCTTKQKPHLSASVFLRACREAGNKADEIRRDAPPLSGTPETGTVLSYNDINSLYSSACK